MGLRLIVLFLALLKHVSTEFSVQDPFQSECSYRKIQCHERAICRLDLVTQLFYCQCLPGYTGDGINNCQEPDEIITVSDEGICNRTEPQTCLITKTVGGNVTFSIAVSGSDLKQIAWFKYYASQGPVFHRYTGCEGAVSTPDQAIMRCVIESSPFGYRRRLTPSANLLPRVLLKNQNLEMELINISEDDFYPNRFWAEIEMDIIKHMEQEIVPYDDAPFELLNPSRIRYYFVLDSPPIDIGEYLIGDVIQIHIASYVSLSNTAYIKWFKEPLNLSPFEENTTILSEGAEGILINGIRDDEFGHIRAVVYDFSKEIPGSVAVAERLFHIRKDITKTCTGSVRSSHSCRCNVGFEGNGVHCIDIDECTQGMPYHCLPKAACVNTHGSYKCQCVDGYDGDGIYSCIDVDECVQNRDICNEDALCVNTLGSFLCVCQSGYFGDGNQCIAASIWSPWSPWSICSATCGSQNQMRIRMCTHPESGMRCEGPSAELQSCEEREPCPVNGQWSEWSPWSVCSASCFGIKTRVRICDEPPPAYGGLACSGPTEQGTTCGSGDCPVIGIWSSWTAWTPCPITCGMSLVKRSRVCKEVFPGNRVADCVGSNQQERSCGFPVDYCKYLPQSPDSIMTGRWI